MEATVDIGSLAVLQGLGPETRDALMKEAKELAFEAGEFILHQHDDARALYVLLSGSVEFLMNVEGVDDLFLGMTAEPGALIGWSVVREPHRYTASVRCREPCRVLRVPREALARVLSEDPRAGCQILRGVADALLVRLEDARSLLGRLPDTGPGE